MRKQSLVLLVLVALFPCFTMAAAERDAESGLWQQSLQGNHAQDFAAYLARYPRGKFADRASRMLQLRQQALRMADETTVEYPPLDGEPEMDPVVLYSSAGRGRGNCSACHAIPALPDMVAGDVGPPMIGMKQRFPDIELLMQAIANQKKFSPGTSMPPFGRNRILTPAQIEGLAKYLYQY